MSFATIVLEWLCEQFREECKGASRRDRINRRPPINLRVEIGTPGIAVKRNRGRTARPRALARGRPRRLKAQGQPVAHRHLRIEADRLEQVLPKFFDLPAISIFAFELGTSSAEIVFHFVNAHRLDWRQPLLEEILREPNDRRHLFEVIQSRDRTLEQRVMKYVDVGAGGKFGVHHRRASDEYSGSVAFPLWRLAALGLDTTHLAAGGTLETSAQDLNRLFVGTSLGR
jgi:hypothetical protein